MNTPFYTQRGASVCDSRRGCLCRSIDLRGRSSITSPGPLLCIHNEMKQPTATCILQSGADRDQFASYNWPSLLFNRVLRNTIPLIGIEGRDSWMIARRSTRNWCNNALSARLMFPDGIFTTGETYGRLFVLRCSEKEYFSAIRKWSYKSRSLEFWQHLHSS